MTTGPGPATTGRAKGAARRTRDTAPATLGPSAHLVSLQPLSTEASDAVLRDAAPTAGTAEEAAVLGERLGGHALALEVTGRYLASPTSRHRNFTAYQDALDNEFVDLLGAEHPQAADPDIARTVMRHTFDLSLTQRVAGHLAPRRRSGKHAAHKGSDLPGSDPWLFPVLDRCWII
ncbi:hypothetical protein [Streptomyces niveus]|uniref:hypothetical protein n=1 Tax=Streptomyces niveus TaxID=193462 RepID=UPI0036AD796D